LIAIARSRIGDSGFNGSGFKVQGSGVHGFIRFRRFRRFGTSEPLNPGTLNL
jgi:hypothetical protein